LIKFLTCPRPLAGGKNLETMNIRNKKKIVTVTNITYRGLETGHVISATDEDGSRYAWSVLDDEIAYQYNIGDVVDAPAGSKIKK
jgi:hypothetical protein